jgi:hypothetical protein
VILLAAMLGGIHVIDFGQSWRLLCGLWTGHVVVLWLVGGTRHLWHLPLRGAPVGLAWSQRDELHSTIATAVLTALAFAIPRWLLFGRHVWTALIIAGAVALVLAVAGSEVATARWCVGVIRGLCAAKPTQELSVAVGTQVSPDPVDLENAIPVFREKAKGCR